MCDQTHCQVVRAADAATERAAQATAGRLLLWRGAPASVFYTASCGGRTEMPSSVWPGADDPPFLPSQDDDACEGAPAWTAEIDERDLCRALRACRISRRPAPRGCGSRRVNASGRVASLELEGLRPDRISGQDLRVAVGRTLGWQHIKSTSFELRRDGEVYRFSGHGYGHGVGLCVIGSARLAERGVSAEAILARYFPALRSPATDQRHLTTAGGRTGVGHPSDPRVASGRGRTPIRPQARRRAPLAAAGGAADAARRRRRAARRHPAADLRARDELARTLGVSSPRR